MAKRFYLIPNHKISIEIGLILNYNEDDDEIETEIGGNFYFYNRTFPLHGSHEFDDLFGDFSIKNMESEIFAYVSPFEEAVQKMISYRGTFDKYIYHLLIYRNEFISDIFDLKMKCRNKNLKINQILNHYSGSLAYEMATNMEDFFEHFCSKN